MTSEQKIQALEAENAQLRGQNKTQEDTIKRLWVDRQKKIKRIQIQQFIIDRAEAEQPPTWKDKIIAEANEVFRDGV